jgi:uncharacterized membrane protein
MAKGKENELPVELGPEFATVIKDLPKAKKDVILRALTISQHHSGPLPSAETIKVYAEVIPNGGDRLMATVEQQLNHRIKLENKSVDRSYNQSSTGQWMAFILALAFGLVAWHLAISGKENAAMVIGAFDIVALVAVFITGRVTKK